MGTYNGEGFVSPDSVWHVAGYSGGASVKSLLGSASGRPAVVVGSGGYIKEIIGAFIGIVDDDVCVFGCNDVAVFLPRIDHMVSWHGDKLELWASLRRNQFGRGYGNREFKTHAASLSTNVDYNWEGLSPAFALSGYFAMQIAYLMGCEPITLIGCPGDNTPCFWELVGRNAAYDQEGVIQQVEREMARLPDFKRRVRSTSGWTREFFGEP